MSTILDDIVARKHEEVAEAKLRRPLSHMIDAAGQAGPPRDFMAAVLPAQAKDTSIRAIAEIKKASPSAGLIRPEFDPVAIGKSYAAHGAAALSILTDETYFQGHLSFIPLVRGVVDLPVLRKDFVVDHYQIYEARAAQADAVLLIAEVLGVDEIAEMLPLVGELGMTALVEVHEPDQLQAVLTRLGPPSADTYLLGVNARDLKIQKTDLAHFERLAAGVPAGGPLVAESGIKTAADVQRVRRAGATTILVGESLLRAEDPGRQLATLLE